MSLDPAVMEKAALGFEGVSVDLHAAVRRAADALNGVGDLSSDEDTDQKFLAWFTPKRDQMIDLTKGLADAYAYIGDQLRKMQQTAEAADWSSVANMPIVPDYGQDAPPGGG
jgi:hypothetical protein